MTDIFKHRVEASIRKNIEEHIYTFCGPIATADMNPPYGSEQYIPQYGYTEALQRWTRLFPREQILIIFHEDYADPERCAQNIRAVLKHGGLKSSPEMIDRACREFSHFQGSIPGAASDIALLNATMRSVNHGLLGLLEKLGVDKVPEAFADGLRE